MPKWRNFAQSGHTEAPSAWQADPTRVWLISSICVIGLKYNYHVHNLKVYLMHRILEILFIKQFNSLFPLLMVTAVI